MNSCKDIVVLFQQKRSGLMSFLGENAQNTASGSVCRDSCKCLSVFQFCNGYVSSMTQPLQTLASWNARAVRQAHLHKDSTLLRRHAVLCSVIHLAKDFHNPFPPLTESKAFPRNKIHWSATKGHDKALEENISSPLAHKS